MKSAILALALFLQIPGFPNGCDSCAVVGWVDAPKENARLSQTATLIIGGWGFQCYTGQVVDRVQVFYRGEDGFDHVVFDGHADDVGWRPDVAEAYLRSCPSAAHANAGFSALVPLARLPLGTRHLTINLWKGPYYEQHQRTITVIP